MRWPSAVLALTSLYALFLVIRLPAAVVYAWLEPHRGDITLSDVSGTIWQGQAKSILLQGHRFEQLSWSTHPFGFARGCIALSVSASLDSSPLRSDLDYCLSGQTTLSNAAVTLPVSQAQKLSNLNYVDADGLLFLDIQELGISDNKVNAVSASARWDNASLAFGETVSLGDLTAEIRLNDHNAIVAIIKDQQSTTFRINLTLTVDDDNTVTAEGFIAPQNPNDAEAHNTLSLLGNPNKQGQYQISYKGTL